MSSVDEQLRNLVRAARAEVEREVDVDAEWTSSGTWRAGAPEPQGRGGSRWLWMAAAAAVLALVIGAAVVLSGDDGDLTVVPGDEPSSSLPDVVVPETSTTTLAPTSTTIAPGEEATTTTTTVLSTTTTTTPFASGPAPVPWRDFPWERTPIGRTCDDQATWCTLLAADPTGEVVSLDPTLGLLTRHGRPAVVADLPGDLVDPFIVAVGPDDVVYLNVQSPAFDDPVGDLVAISLADDDAGREVRRWPEALDRSGDIDLVATPEGLVGVGCCGPEQTRPEVGAPVAFPWVDRSGAEVVSPKPTVRIHTDTLEIERDDHRWSIGYGADDLMLRGMPPIVPTFDGGFVAALERTDNNVVVVRGWPDGSTEHVVVDAYPALLEPTGTVVLPDGDFFARVQLFEPRPSGWDGRLGVDLDTWQVNAPGLDEFLDADDVPWEHDLVAFADAITGPTGPSETRSIEVLDGAAGSQYIQVTTTGYLDDSVFGDRYVFQLTAMAESDGSLRLVGGTYAVTCQPGRGQQDFQQALCV